MKSSWKGKSQPKESRCRQQGSNLECTGREKWALLCPSSCLVPLMLPGWVSVEHLGVGCGQGYGEGERGAEAVGVRSYQYLWNYFLSNCRSSFTSSFRERLYMSLGFPTPHTCSRYCSLPASSCWCAIKSLKWRGLVISLGKQPRSRFGSIPSQLWDLRQFTC